MTRDPFTGYANPGLGTAPYFTMPNPQIPAIRSADLPPVVAPAPGPYGYHKAGVPAEATPGWWARLSGFTFGPGGQGSGQR